VGSITPQIQRREGPVLDSLSRFNYSFVVFEQFAIAEKKNLMKTKFEERVVQKFDPRCPYCDRLLLVDDSQVQRREYPVTCPSCQKTFIKVISRWTAREGTR
jgi:Zn finger protein HypA/HybF involved in hydrogenase expression